MKLHKTDRSRLHRAVESIRKQVSTSHLNVQKIVSPSPTNTKYFIMLQTRQDFFDIIQHETDPWIVRQSMGHSDIGDIPVLTT